MRLKFIFTLAIVCGFSFTQVLNAQQTAKITSSGIGYLEYLPQDYNNNSNDYPIVIFLHGIGEKGTTSTDPATIKSSVQKVANVGLAKYIKYGTQYPFIVISPQLKSNYGTWPANYIMDVLNHVKKNLRIDEKRIYITGLSLGGFGTWTVLGAYPDVFASALPICSGGNALAKASSIAASDIPVWGFHAIDDKVVSYTVTTKMIDAVNVYKPDPLAKTTLFTTGGHIIWDKVYKQTDAIKWMTSFTNGTSGSTSTTNSLPTVSAGSDKSITLPTNEVYIQGTASDSDGSIASYSWTKVSGGSSSLSGVSTSKVRAYNLAEGSYTFRLTVKDNQGASRYDDVKVTVGSSSNSTTTNLAPVANAGSDRTTTYTAITIAGSATDKDGTIASYKWTQTGGAASKLKDPTVAKLIVSELRDGKYYYRLTVTDNDGASDYDDIVITVSNSGATASTSSSTTTNVAPLANAGPDKRIGDHLDALKLYGSGYDKDGSIVSYKWSQFGGPDLNMQNVNSSTLTVSGLEEGTRYYLKLTVKDDDGAVAHDKMYILVNES